MILCPSEGPEWIYNWTVAMERFHQQVAYTLVISLILMSSQIGHRELRLAWSVENSWIAHMTRKKPQRLDTGQAWAVNFVTKSFHQIP